MFITVLSFLNCFLRLQCSLQKIFFEIFGYTVADELLKLTLLTRTKLRDETLALEMAY